LPVSSRFSYFHYSKGIPFMAKSRTLLAWLAVVSAAALLVGCKKTESTSAPPALMNQGQGDAGGTAPAFDAESGPQAAGKKAMVANGCFRCHAVNGARAGGGAMMGGPGGPGGPGGQRPGMGGPGGRMGGGPDLGKAGGDPDHTVAWLMEYIRNPKSKKPEARMPSQERISYADLKAVAEYLASLK
jgi:cbb3-type cytochrome oxidase cytochrome c subunit